MKTKILIVDDEKIIRGILKETLEDAGYEAEATGSGSDAVEMMEKTIFDALVVDIRLEGAASGIDVIKSRSKVSHRLKILVISATSPDFLRPILQAEGILGLVDAVLEKPSDLQPEQFVLTLNRILKK